MSRDAERIALYGALGGLLPEGTTLRYESVPEDDGIIDSDDLWVLCKLKPFGAAQKNIGVSNPLKRTRGFFIIKIYDREDHGYADIYRMIDTVEAGFLHKTFNSGELYIERISNVEHPAYKGWNCIDAIVEYHNDSST
jgi:hypothetical protein